MRNNHNETARTKELKQALGEKIKEIRTLKDEDGLSQRKLAEAVDIPPSNMKYIEDGVNAPSPRVYDEIIACLKPSAEEREYLDRLYSEIRETPPPDVCRIIRENDGMNEVLRVIEGKRLERPHLEKMRELLETFFNGEMQSSPSGD